jgi:hypothetical protein
MTKEKYDEEQKEEKIEAQYGARTRDAQIKSLVLYRLS